MKLRNNTNGDAALSYQKKFQKMRGEAGKTSLNDSCANVIAKFHCIKNEEHHLSFQGKYHCYLLKSGKNEKQEASRKRGGGLTGIPVVILLHEKFLQFDWLRAVVF